MSELWSYGPDSRYPVGAVLIGFKVEAADGHIGKVDSHTEDVGSSYIVVDTGPWIFGKEVLLPAGTIERVDMEGEKIRVSRTREQIKNAPEYDKDKHRGDAAYRSRVADYYGRDQG
ncbi:MULTISPECIES: PRC-barrel domain-containing protein [unclassified Streptomyces]|uniref:PRC-barrel domain-containing protein n=1 Tax=unclassified Streptomyces TaxID=2593676 RepID=UPI00226EC6AE|nr:MULTISPECIES: PRC-barrel domain-containing protein [unclassified Streptomyces]MCY0919757.1 PRC-barrel domain-containing protein [Streptomyces sp. H27-G5]MCY0958690.1 PRC-barrel domain-containing protein [Streptomyces sp. H27-H5]